MSDDNQALEEILARSWEKTILQFSKYAGDSSMFPLAEIAILLDELRTLGYHEKLYVETSHHVFIFSRSTGQWRAEANHLVQLIGNNDGSLRLLKTTKGSIASVIDHDRFETYDFDNIQVNDKLISLLDELSTRPIEHDKING